tara:strand:- start:555 stop:1121 length:567 start_codon:yes stop_codon:yes gene_type:complete
MIKTCKTTLTAIALASLSLVAACDEQDKAPAETATRDDGTLTLAAGLGADEQLDTLRSAIEQSELSGVFEGAASYTMLAPCDAAFEALGEEGTDLLREEQRPLLAAILRDHLLPGHLTPESIGEAIDRAGGPVTMTTLGQTTVTFDKDGEQLSVAAGDTSRAAFVGAAIAANNGVVIPIDAVLLPPRG